MTHRRPSLRQLRSYQNENVVVLPGAANVAVKQPCNKAGRAARQAIREGQSGKFPYKMPGVREAEQRAAAILEVQCDPGVILAHAILADMDEAMRREIIGRLAGTAQRSRANRQAFEVANSTVLSFGQQLDLMTALAELRVQQ